MHYDPTAGAESRAEATREAVSYGDPGDPSPIRGRRMVRRAIPVTDPLEPDTTDFDDPLLRRNRGWQERGRAS